MTSNEKMKKAGIILMVVGTSVSLVCTIVRVILKL